MLEGIEIAIDDIASFESLLVVAHAANATLSGVSTAAQSLPDSMGAALLTASHLALTRALQVTSISSSAALLAAATLTVILIRAARKTVELAGVIRGRHTPWMTGSLTYPLHRIVSHGRFPCGPVHMIGTASSFVGRYIWIMRSLWDADESRVLRLPSGRLLRGRGHHEPFPSGATPDFAVYLLGKRPAPSKWEARWVLWPDFWLPKDHDDARDALHEAWLRSEEERVEIACAGSCGRTGTALACIAVLDGVPADKAVTFVREHYNPRAVETPWQRRYVAHFTAD